MFETVWPFVIASLLFFASRLRFNFKIETDGKTHEPYGVIYLRFYPNVENSILLSG